MIDPKFLLLGAMLVLAATYLTFWIRVARRDGHHGGVNPGAAHLAIGFFTNFFDTLGIGSFATTTTIYRLRRLVADLNIPGTLNVGHTVATVVQALIYITIVEVDFTTLLLLIASAVAGSWIGASIVAGLNRQAMQRGMGMALLVAAVLMLITAVQEWSRPTPDALPAIQLLPLGGNALQLSGGLLVVGCAINFVLGALMTLGIGLYAPCMIMVSLLGMNPTAAFPIMMGSCAFLMPAASFQFIRKQKYDLKAAIGLALGGAPGVLVAALIVKSLPLAYVRWLVVIVVVYAATMLLRSSMMQELTNRRIDGLTD